MAHSNSNLPIDQLVLRRGDGDYEGARRSSMWNARVPERYPAVIVRVQTVADVVAAVKLAKREGLRVSVCSGGHSWAGNHLREGGLLLDMSALQEVTIDKKAMRATTGPGRSGHELVTMLGRQGLFFPTGHCKGVCVGGYLLQGGFGWHSRALGLACMSVVGIDLVTADGEILHANPDQNADLYWAARGAGPGFFGVVTRFHLRVYPKPKIIGSALHTYPIEALDEVLRFVHDIGPEVSAAVELQVMVSRRVLGIRGQGIELFAPVFADSLGEVSRALAFLNKGTLKKRALLRVPFAPLPLGLLYRGVMLHYPDNHRYAVDNMWTRAPIDALLPGIHKIVETMPPAPSHMLWLNWAPPPDRPDMAFSVEDQSYIALYGGWKDAADDPKYAAWATERMREMAPLASGCQLADENLGQRPSRFVTDEHMARLEQIRSARDPQGRFHTFMGRL